MKESWRWFGPLDDIALPEIAQTGADVIVTALHEIPYGEVWSQDAIAARQSLISDNDLGLSWEVVESLPVHEDIKLGTGNLSQLFANYRQSLANLANQGIRTVCYNFMPLLDWTRTTLDAPLRGGATALRYSNVEMAAFDVFMLERKQAGDDFPEDVLRAGKAWFETTGPAEQNRLLESIMAGLPGAFERYTINGLRSILERYEGLDRNALRANYRRFIDEVMPTAADLGVRMCVHPDDPPRDILGLPRIMSCADDIRWLYVQSELSANGLTLCSGSLGANLQNDVAEITAEFSDRIHFAHLRNVTKEPDGSFQEAAHLDGDNDMVAIIAHLLAEEQRREANGQTEYEIPFRPDHGHEIAQDLSRNTHPGYPLIGRLRGLAELRGIIAAKPAVQLSIS